jgi:MoaA/NifB/PqqE/SkfB family radical SAM enzyme
MLVIAKNCNIKDIDFSGGEPTLRKDLPLLIKNARKMGFKQISIITNGTQTHNHRFLKELAENGLNDVLVSLHGHDDATHDHLTKIKGSFRKILKTIENVKKLNLRLRINTVVNRYNYIGILKLAKIALEYRPNSYNLICFNDWVNASKLTENIAVQYSEVSGPLNETVEFIEPLIPKVTVRYIPFCQMVGNEKHVCGLLQNDYDSDEWIDSVKRIITDINSPKILEYFEYLNKNWQRHKTKLKEILSVGEIELLNKRDSQKPFTNFESSLSIVAHKVENFVKRQSYIKDKNCSGCSRNLICDGIEKSYAQHFSTSELIPIPGPAIIDPMHFRKHYIQELTHFTV